MQRVCSLAALLWIGVTAVFGQAPGATLPDPRAVEELHNLALVVQKTAGHVAAREMAAILTYDYVSAKALQFLLQRPGLALPANRAEVMPALTALMKQLNAVQNAALNQNAGEAAKHLSDLTNALVRVKELYPPEFLKAVSELANRYFCPAHTEVTGQEGQTCAKCGRSLQAMDAFCGLPPAEPIIKASLNAEGGLATGKTNKVMLRLARKDGQPVRENDLLPTHTERIHMFAIDPTLSDYHHEHPRAADTAGEYFTSMLPKFPGGYRVWLDLLPAMSRREEMPSADLGPIRPAQVNRAISDEFTGGGYRLKFVVPQAPLKAGFPGWAKLTVTDSNGAPCGKLEPIMGNFAHFVAFHEDFQTVFHLHAAGFKDITDPALRSGPDVQLYLPGLKAGFVRVFAQVQIDGEKITAPFGLMVQP